MGSQGISHNTLILLPGRASVALVCEVHCVSFSGGLEGLYRQRMASTNTIAFEPVCTICKE